MNIPCTVKSILNIYLIIFKKFYIKNIINLFNANLQKSYYNKIYNFSLWVRPVSMLGGMLWVQPITTPCYTRKGKRKC